MLRYDDALFSFPQNTGRCPICHPSSPQQLSLTCLRGLLNDVNEKMVGNWLDRSPQMAFNTFLSVLIEAKATLNILRQ
ncbi:unnamed protein product [Photorhabdus laumondii subsp. laumondii TTO1]|uniref:Photorhabdus luminescens subsp. laumondii TTO1 complete genome segment 4/17 n=1 Tax=Photorhabdus laumondii subsp. laumondii (strain DSM 15139 / CIP 105565 / TT01) TaxID=243265 RepID=Q7N7L9_PHOLL|nr:unnamed protein product [Photorhabdus laumondii subsp. laumondii TTO1]